MRKTLAIIGIILVFILVGVVTSGCVGSTSEEKVEEKVKPKSNAYQLAFIETGGKPSQSLVNQFDDHLKELNIKCTENETKISDIIVVVQQELEKKGVKETLLKIAKSINESIPEEYAGSASCAETAAALVILTGN